MARKLPCYGTHREHAPKEDEVFAQLLMRIRTATCTQEDIALLQSRVVNKADARYPAYALHVFKTNKEVDTFNAEKLGQLATQVFQIKAVDGMKDVQIELINVETSAKPLET